MSRKYPTHRRKPRLSDIIPSHGGIAEFQTAIKQLFGVSILVIFARTHWVVFTFTGRREFKFLDQSIPWIESISK